MGIFIGSNSNKAKFLEIINLATGGGFSLAGNKLIPGAGHKPTSKSSPEFRKKLASYVNTPTTITLHFSKAFLDSGDKKPTRFINDADAVSKYSNKAGTGMNVIMWGDESEEKSIPKTIQKSFMVVRAAVLIHELNAHIFPTIINDKRSNSAIMEETNKMIRNGPGIPPFFIPLWTTKSMLKGHGTKVNDEKGKKWAIPAN